MVMPNRRFLQILPPCLKERDDASVFILLFPAGLAVNPIA